MLANCIWVCLGFKRGLKAYQISTCRGITTLNLVNLVNLAKVSGSLLIVYLTEPTTPLNLLSLLN